MHLRSAAVFSDYKKQFPNVQLHVDRSYGSRVVGAVLDNLADFGFTQLPVQEKKLQVVKIHSDEIRLISAGGPSAGGQGSVTCYDLTSYPLPASQIRDNATRLNAWMEPVEDDIHTSMELDSTEMIKQFVMAGLGDLFSCRLKLPRRTEFRPVSGVSLAPDPMVRQLGLIYRKDKSLSKTALGFIQVTIDHAGDRDT